jgi:glutamate-1-semialdehyde 2,1-aminomutase
MVSLNSRILDRYLSRSPKSRKMYEQARGILPDGGGGDMQCYQPYPIYIERAAGSKIYDIDGNEYVDCFNGAGTVLLGHSHPAITEAIKLAQNNRIPASVAYENEIEYARLLQKYMPSMEMIRFQPSGSEACQSAIRVARAFTGKEKIAKFEGGYHGQATEMMVSVEPSGDTCGPEHQPCNVPWRTTMPRHVLESVLVLPYNNTEASVELIESNAGDLAAVMVETALGHSGLIPADIGYITALREVTRKHGILLLFDEVITGFRLGLGGAQELYGIVPDLTMLAKPAGGGFPLGVFGGRRDVMGFISQEKLDKKVYSASSTSGHYLGVTAGLAMMRELEKGTYYKHVNELAYVTANALKQIFADAGISCYITGELFGRWRGFMPQFVDRAPVTARDFCRGDMLKLWLFLIGMISMGIYTPPTGSPHIGAAHTKQDVDKILKAAKAVAADLKEL